MFKQFAINYHKALKKILKLPKYYSNHIAASILNTFTFNHLINTKILKFYFWLKNCNSPCFKLYKYYFMNMSTFKHDVSQIFSSVYDIADIFENDFDAILSSNKFYTEE